MLATIAAAMLTATPPIPVPPLPVGDFDWGPEAIEEAQRAERRLARSGFEFDGNKRACLWAHLLLSVAQGIRSKIGALAEQHSRMARPTGTPVPHRGAYSPAVQAQLNRAVKQLQDTRDQRCGGKPPRANRGGADSKTASADPDVQAALEWLHANPEKPDAARLVLKAWWRCMAPVPGKPAEALEAGALFAGAAAVAAMGPAEFAALLAAVAVAQ